MEGSIRKALSTNRGSLPETAFSSCFTCSLMSVEDHRRKQCYFQFFLFPPTLQASSSREPLIKGQDVANHFFCLVGLSNTYRCQIMILRHNQEIKIKAGVGERVEGDRKRKVKRTTKNKTNTWRFNRSLYRKRLSKCKQW